MGKILITPNNSSQQMEFDAVTNIKRNRGRVDSDYRCPREYRLRIDIMPGSHLSSRWYITEKQFQEIKELNLESAYINKTEDFTVAVLIAETIRGTGNHKGPLFNVLSNYSLYSDKTASDMLVFLETDAEFAKCYPHCSSREIQTNFIRTHETQQDLAIRSIIGLDCRTDTKAVLDELELYDLRKGKYLMNVYFDGERMVADRVWEVKKEM